MSFFKDVQGDDSSILKKRSLESFNRALNIFGNTIDNGVTAYYDGRSHLKSFAHPFYPIAQLTRNALRFTYNAFVFVSALVSALFTGNVQGAIRALGNMCNIILASVLEVLNVACSIISLIFRSGATVCNLGYTSTQTTSQNSEGPTSDNGTVCDNTDRLTKNSQEDNVHKTAFTLV
ncbi:MAG: hypothetical protein P1U36_06735 [Legionellaceae bacterium]|nr:hypothetical protein [Legionellaceae bacterium]